MSADYATWSVRLRQFERALAELIPLGAMVGVPSPAGEEWYELLRGKLLPQVALPPLLVVGIVGGTNIGKSLLFNQLAGEVASAVSPLAAGTKHPICLVPPGAGDPALLGRLFAGFQLRPWQSPEDPMQESSVNWLFWRVGQHVPQRLVLLDAPDVDSDVTVNWERARAIRQVADVLLAVLTQQKYNDAAVKQFFREAVEADKPIIVLFNQCDLEADRAYWPLWLATFCAETGAQPELVYVIPHDRQAADAYCLPLYEVGRDGRGPLSASRSLRDELAAMHFDAIKIRTLRGALARVLDAERGGPAYLARIRAASAEFELAHRALMAGQLARVAWPSLPASILVDEIRQWWDEARPPWARRIHSFYRTLGQGVTWPVRRIWNMAQPQPAHASIAFQRQERQAILQAVEKMLDELGRLAEVGNDTLRPKLLALLSGTARQDLLARVDAAHQALPAVDEHFRAFLRAELDAWREQNPGVVRFLRSLDHVAAMARPAMTVLLLISGWHVAGELAGQAAAHAATHTASQLAQEAAIAGGIAGSAEALVSTTSEGVRQAAGRLFVRLQSRYAQQRAEWLAKWLEHELLGELLADLRRGAEVPQSGPFREVVDAVEQFSRLGLGREAPSQSSLPCNHPSGHNTDLPTQPKPTPTAGPTG